MDSIHFDAYASYSDSSTPRTPSPRTSVSSDDVHYNHSPHYKPNLDVDPVRNIFADHGPDDSVVPETHPVDVPYWNGPSHTNPFAFNPSRGSLLQELYDHDLAPEHPPTHEVYMDQSAEPPFGGGENWSHMPHTPDPQQHHSQQQASRGPHDFSLMRRATFPYVRHDRDDGVPLQQYPPFISHDNGPMLHHPYTARNETLYGEPLPLSAEPSALHGEPFIPSMNSSPHSSYHEFEDNHHHNTSIKLEDTAPVIVPSQTAFYRPPSSSPCHPMSMSYLSPHTGLPVQHTDDAASKETQYLRRRCFNCHTTEPPSWRRSTLNPGKIVCNKCGLYERTHLRPRPLRFDELRAGNKARKQSKGTVSPKAKMALVKKEPREFGLARRSSVSSSSSVQSGSGASDWDDTVSVYSAGSAPPTSFNSPNSAAFPLARDSQSPPRDGGIRLPNAPLSDIASMQSQQQQPPQQQQQQQQQQPQQQQQQQQQQQHPPTSPRKAHTSPYYPSVTAASANNNVPQDFFRRGSMPEVARSETTGWQNMDLGAGKVVEGLRTTAVAS